MTRSARLLTLFPLVLIASVASAVDVYGVSVNGDGSTKNLVRFNSSAPGAILQNVAISGLSAGDRLVGLDFRPNGGSLYALGSLGNIYTIDKATGTVTSTIGLIGAALSGNSFGVGFNPVPDRLRVVSNSGQNLRINVDTGAVTVDTSLSYAAGDAYQYERPNIIAVDYTNSVLGPIGTTTSTALYDLDSSLDTLAQQTNPNGGILSTRGALGFNATNLSDVDIYSTGSQANGFTNTMFAALNVPGGGSTFYTINTGTGAASLVGSIGGDRVGLIATQAVPEPATMIALGLGAAAMLRRRRK